MIPKEPVIVAGAGLVWQFFVAGTNVPFFDVSVSTLGMAAAGSMIAFAYGTPVESRTKLYGYAIGGMFVGIWSVKILPQSMGWDWYIMESMQPPLAGLIALVSRWVIPLFIDQIPSILRRVFNTAPPGDKS